MMIIKTIAPAICYFIFNWQYFRCVESIQPVKPMGIGCLIGTYVLNFGVFTICTFCNLHLIVNWLIFLGLLFLEQLILYRQPVRCCLLPALLGTQLGLAVNILFRSLFAIILGTSLVAFDNSVGAGNMKAFPVLLGFLAAALIFWLAVRFSLLKKLELVIGRKGLLAFLIGLLVAMYFYLCMNLFVYYIKDNNLILKLWSMKSAIFVIVGEFLAVILSMRMGEIAEYRAKSQESREILAREKAREVELRAIAAIDPLTGCENRRQAQIRIQQAMESDRDFCLCFVDLNRLKRVNDSFGHEMGDKYILTAVKALEEIRGDSGYLFRYGGDEFLLLLYHVGTAKAMELLGQAQRRMKELRAEQGYPFSMSFCYGAATPDDGSEALEVIRTADERMYQMKLKLENMESKEIEKC